MIWLLACTAPDDPGPGPGFEVTIETGLESEPFDTDTAPPVDSEPIECGGVHENGVSVSSLVELEALQGIVQINGGLTLRDIDDAGNLWHLSCLETVGENLVVEQNPHFRNLLGLESLREVGGTLQIRYNDELRDVDELADLVSVGTNLTVSDNDQQVRVEMPALQSIGGDLRVDDSPAMEQILFGALEVADDVEILADALELDLTKLDDARVDVRNVLVEDLSAFASLRTGNLYIDGPALTSLAGLPDGGTYSTVYVGYAPHITSLETLASFSVEDGLAFVALGIEDLDGLDVQVGNALSLYENEQLTSLDGVGATAPTSVYISGAPNLASVEALSELSTLTSLRLHHTGLTSLAGVDGMDAVHSLDLEDNGSLELSLLDGVELGSVQVTDQDVSGTLTDPELTTLWLERATGSLTWTGTDGGRVWLEDTPIELDASELVTMTGDLTLDGVDAWPILTALESADDITISSSEITEITLPSLTQVTELRMGSSEFVESVDLGALTTADAVYVSVGGTHLDLGSLSSVDTVDIGMTDLTDLDLGSLKRTKDLDLTGCARLEDLSGLAIERVDDLTLHGLKALTSLTGLEALTEISDRFYLRGLDSLQDFEGMGDTAIGGDLEAYQNEGFIDLDGLEGVSVAGEVYFVSNTNLERVDGLSGVVEIGELNLSSNDALAEIELSSLTTVTNDVTIYNNAVLTDISGLSGLTSVGRNFKIKDNPELSTTDAEALRDSIGTANIGGTITISGNGI